MYIISSIIQYPMNQNVPKAKRLEAWSLAYNNIYKEMRTRETVKIILILQVHWYL